LTTDPGKKLAALLKRIRGRISEPPADPWQQERPQDAEPLLWHLLYSFMVWEAGAPCAGAASRRLHDALVDYNELRVCLPQEVKALLGESYPRVEERAQRLRAVLNDIYRREHRVTLAHLPELGRRESRLYLESLSGMPQFVSARLALLSLDAHAFPLDERLRDGLVAEHSLPADLALEEAAGWLERQIRAGEATSAYLLLEAWMNEKAARCDRASGERKSRRRTTRP
jgi:hypothetical protein